MFIELHEFILSNKKNHHFKAFDKKYELVCHIFVHLSISLVMPHDLCFTWWVIFFLYFCKREKEEHLLSDMYFSGTLATLSDEFRQHNIDRVSENQYCTILIIMG